MAHTVAPTGLKVYLGGLEINSHLNSYALGDTSDLPDDTVFGDSQRQRLVGLRHKNFSMAGFVDLAGAEDQDALVRSFMGVDNTPLIIVPVSAVIGGIAEFGLIDQGQYACNATVGENFKFTLNGELASQRWVRSKDGVMWLPSTVVVGTGNGTAVQLGAVSASQKIYAGISVFAADSLVAVDVVLQSASDEAFTSPTTRLSFTAFNRILGQIPAGVQGSITDTWWRFAVTDFNGTSCQFIGVAGIATATA